MSLLDSRCDSCGVVFYQSTGHIIQGMRVYCRECWNLLLTKEKPVSRVDAAAKAVDDAWEKFVP